MPGPQLSRRHPPSVHLRAAHVRPLLLYKKTERPSHPGKNALFF